MYSACARTWNYSTRYFPRESRRDLKDIEYPAFCQERKKKKKRNGDAKNGGRDANIFASRQSQRGESVQKVSLRQRQVITYIHIYAQRWNSRWRWITWSGFKARSPPSRVTLTRRASLSSRQVSHQHSYPWSMRRARVLPEISAVRRSITRGPTGTSITAHANLTRAESTETHLKKMCDTLSYISQIICGEKIPIVILILPYTDTSRVNS